MDLVAQHGVIGKLITEFEYDDGIMSVIDVGGRAELVSGKTWPVDKSELLEDCAEALDELVTKYYQLGLTRDEIDSIFTLVLDED